MCKRSHKIEYAKEWDMVAYFVTVGTSGISELIDTLNLMEQFEQKNTGMQRLFLSENWEISVVLLEREREREREREIK
jgi:hypothetical protein